MSSQSSYVSVATAQKGNANTPDPGGGTVTVEQLLTTGVATLFQAANTVPSGKAQQFTAPTTGQFNAVGLRIGRTTATTGTIRISIQADNGADNPDGVNLAFIDVDVNTLPPIHPTIPNTYVLSGNVNVVSGQKYWIVYRVISNLDGAVQTSSYSGGIIPELWAFSADSVTWTTNATFDSVFTIDITAPASGYIWELSHVGSVYEADPDPVADGETQGFAIDAYGRLKVIGADADNAPQTANPFGVGGKYNALLPSYDDGDQVFDQHDSSGRKIVTDDQLLAAFAAEDFATETTVAAILADTAAMETLLTSIDGKDFATETTLAAILTAFNAEDFATETTLAAILADTASLDGKDFATETTLAAILADTAILSAWDTGAGTVGATTQRVHLSDESLAALENIEAVIQTGDIVDTAYIDAASTAIPGNATNPAELVASLSADVSRVQVFDTTGFFLEIMIGAAAAETRKFLIGPGSNETIEVTIPSGTRISVRRIDDPTAIAVGELALNFIS